jgi:hypothetical protein
MEIIDRRTFCAILLHFLISALFPEMAVATTKMFGELTPDDDNGKDSLFLVDKFHFTNKRN